MRKFLGSLLLWQSLVGAEPHTYQAMVLKVSGPAIAHPFSSIQAEVITGQRWDQGWVIDIPPGSQVTVLLLERGQRVEIKGGGQVRVSDKGLEYLGCAARNLPSTQHRLNLTGENHRQIGGLTVRANDFSPARLDRVEVMPQGWLRVSCPAEVGSPPDLQAHFFGNYAPPNFNEALKVVRTQDLYRLSQHRLQGQRQNDRWSWQLPLPVAEPKSLLGLQIHHPSQGEWLYTKFYLPAAGEDKALSQSLSDLRDWAKREPQSPEPHLVQATLLEERGRLEEALAELEQSLQLEPKDHGLQQMKVRLLMDLGRYSQAREMYRALP